MTTSLPITSQVDLNKLALVTQDIDMTGNLTVVGTSSFTGNQTVTGNSTVSGNETVTGNLVVNGTLTNTGAAPRAVSLTATTAAPTLAQSGTSFILNGTTGITVTLPATPTIGTTYGFYVGTLATGSNVYKIITTGASCFFLGGLYMDKALTITRYDALIGASMISVNLNGTTTGGLVVGDYFTIKALSTTAWQIEGTVSGSGSLATPFAVS